MKVKLSVSIDNEVLSNTDKLVELGVFRNRSHAVEFAIEEMAREEAEEAFNAYEAAVRD